MHQQCTRGIDPARDAEARAFRHRNVDRCVAASDALPADTLVLPSHGKPFTGLHVRIAQLLQHHDARYADVLQACAVAPQSAADLLPVLFKRKLDMHQTTFAMGESIAHLHKLWFDARLTRTRDHDGVYRFQPTD